MSKITFVLWTLLTALLIFIVGGVVSNGFLVFSSVAEAWLLVSLIGGVFAACARRERILYEKAERERCSH